MTPQGQVSPPSQPGWFSRNWKWLAGCGCAVPVLCCGSLMVLAALAPESDFGKAISENVRVNESPARARVDCDKPTSEGVPCTVQRTGGAGSFTACWDLGLACQNGYVSTGHHCQAVGAAQGSAQVLMSFDVFSDPSKCDVVLRGDVKNLTLE